MNLLPPCLAEERLLTLSVAVRLLVQSELAGIVLHLELLQQAFDDLFGCVLRADVEMRQIVLRQIKGSSLFCGSTVRFFLLVWWNQAVAEASLGARLLHSLDRDRSTEPQVHLNETCVGSVCSLKNTRKRSSDDCDELQLNLNRTCWNPRLYSFLFTCL